jgi:hypothetical protein
VFYKLAAYFFLNGASPVSAVTGLAATAGKKLTFSPVSNMM